jgi:hypothetical protein
MLGHGDHVIWKTNLLPHYHVHDYLRALINKGLVPCQYLLSLNVKWVIFVSWNVIYMPWAVFARNTVNLVKVVSEGYSFDQSTSKREMHNGLVYI